MRSRGWKGAVAVLATLALGGCDKLATPEGLTGAIIGGTIIGAAAPTSDIRQIYYLGMFDPQGQLPPQMYRIRVNGQSSFLSKVNFASGWVPAPLVDSLGGQVTQAKDGALEEQRGGALQQELFQALLRLKEEQGRLRALETDVKVDRARVSKEALQ